VLEAELPGRVLAVYAHPDDPEISAGGTLARWADGGAEVHVLVTTRGDKGTSDPDADTDALARLREKETAPARVRPRQRATWVTKTASYARCGPTSCGAHHPPDIVLCLIRSCSSRRLHQPPHHCATGWGRSTQSPSLATRTTS
jgi:hypothetical protein